MQLIKHDKRIVLDENEEKILVFLLKQSTTLLNSIKELATINQLPIEEMVSDFVDTDEERVAIKEVVNNTTFFEKLKVVGIDL